MEQKKQPFISVILLSYNYAHLITRALDAISRQSFRDFELVFVDDCSTDNSREVMLDFAAKHPDIPLVPVLLEHNSGIPTATNRGAEAANGKYLLFHDADDWMDDNTLELLAEAARSNDADRVIAAFRDVDERGRVRQVRSLGKEPNHWLYTMHHANLYRASIYREHHIQTKTLWNSTDMEQSFKFSSFTRRAAFVYTPCYNYYFHEKSSSHRSWDIASLLNDERHSFTRFLEECVAYLPPESAADYPMAVYSLTRFYYSFTLLFIRGARARDAKRVYNAEHQAMKKYLPDYLRCTGISLRDKYATRPYGRYMVILLYSLERLHLMPAAITVYSFLSRYVRYLGI